MLHHFGVRVRVAISVGMLFDLSYSPFAPRLPASCAQQPGPADAENIKNSALEKSSKHHLERIGMAIRKYHQVHGRMPARATVNKTGKPLLSWRVLILPYLGHEDLFKQFRLEEAWNSPHNKKLIDRMPPVFADPETKKPSIMTRYVVPVGKRTLFESVNGLKLTDIKKAADKTIMVVEANPDCCVVWTQPADIQYDPAHPRKSVTHSRPNGFLAVMASGTVFMIAKNTDVVAIRYMFANVSDEAFDPSP
jgi:Protein of unknown function (DUF1559)